MNEYVWGLYLKSGGSDTVEFFKKNFADKITDDYASVIKKFKEVYCIDKYLIEETEQALQAIVNNVDYSDFGEYEPSDMAEYERFIDDELCAEWDFVRKEVSSDKEAFEAFIPKYISGDLDYFSTALTINCPDYFIPYYYQFNYNVIERIASEFDIELPQIPNKRDYKGRFFHYGELCKVFTKFRIDNNWTPFEFFAFLYDFAPKYIGGINSYIVKEEELPVPKSAFFVGGGGNNADALAEDNSNEITVWQCNPETRAGDMIVMYLRTPISSISSIWRSCSVGFNDPFFYYYRCTYIGHPVKGKRLGIDKMKKDRTLSKMSIVKGNMQGVNGVELKPSDYNHIVDKIKADVYKLEYEEITIDNNYVNEKDVEERVIKPFLKDDMGYDTEDYIQQLNVPIGNHNNTLIPDFVLLPKTYRGRHVAYAVVEAKKSIKNEKELLEAIDQVSSYSLLLSANHAAVASQEGIWILSQESRYTDVILSHTWDELNANNDKMYEVKKLIGKV